MILNIYSPDLKCFETLLKHYYVTSADFKRFVTFWKRLSSDSVLVLQLIQDNMVPYLDVFYRYLFHIKTTRTYGSINVCDTSYLPVHPVPKGTTDLHINILKITKLESVGGEGSTVNSVDR